MLTQILITACVVLALLVLGCLVGSKSRTDTAPHDGWWMFGRLCALADMAAVAWLWWLTFQLNGGAPHSVQSAIASVVYVALMALLIAACGPVSAVAEDRAWLFVMLLAFAGGLALAVQYQPDLSRF